MISKIATLFVLTTLTMFAQEPKPETSNNPKYGATLHSGMSLDEAQMFLANLKSKVENGALKNFNDTNKAVKLETDILRNYTYGFIVEPNPSAVALQYVRVNTLEQKRLEAAQKVSGALSETQENYYAIRRFLAPETVETWDAKNQQNFWWWYDAMLSSRLVDHEGFDEVMLAAAQLLPAGRKHDEQVRLWEDHGTKPHYIECGVISCSDPKPFGQ